MTQAVTTQIKGKAYSSKDLEIFLLGRVCRGVLEIDWDTKGDISDVYVIGSVEPIDGIEGNRAHEASITLLMDEFIGLEVSAGGNIMDLAPFDITIVFKKFALISHQTLKGCKAKGRGLSVKAGDNGALAWKIPLRVQAIPAIKPL